MMHLPVAFSSLFKQLRQWTGRPVLLNTGLVGLAILISPLGGFQTLFGQPYQGTTDDYTIFGRKAPMTLGSSFSALGSFSPYENPADLAFVMDNSVAFNLSASDRGLGHHISFTGPNFSLSSAFQEGQNKDGYTHTKKLLRFSFGFALGDPASAESWALALGLAINRKSDAVEPFLGTDSADALGANFIGDSVEALTASLGAVFKIGRSKIELNILDLKLSGDDGYELRFVLGYRTVTRFGLRLAFQGMPGTGYNQSDFGLKIGLAQSLFNARLDSRLQLVSFFSEEGEATMQNITAGVGYRLKPKDVRGALASLLDTEFSYTLSFLAVPNVIGTHMLALVKYF
ncbi:MAG: hypothetical protein IH972_01280 [Candidatus Marinimicrobia bacterium]|nr:hypothetical protein [Candidatus Neomarinimicrobiota bacterium]